MNRGNARIVGAVLVALGFVTLALGGFGYRKTENIAEIGDFKMNVSERKRFDVPPLVSGIVILAGAALLLRGGAPKE